MKSHKKEVAFYKYCNKCEYIKLKESQDPCHACLNFPYNLDSSKPVYFKERRTNNRCLHFL